MRKPFLLTRIPERLLVAGLALIATAAFFCEYLPPAKRVHLFSDIEIFHYPLQRYAFDDLRSGRLPLASAAPEWPPPSSSSPSTITRSSFQAIQVPPGEHTVVFQYRSRWLPLGAAIGLAALLGMCYFLVGFSSLSLSSGWSPESKLILLSVPYL